MRAAFLGNSHDFHSRLSAPVGFLRSQESNHWRKELDMTFVIVANAVAVAAGVALLFAVMRAGYQVAGTKPLADREPAPVPVDADDGLERAA
jgi:hypothetical protein